MRRAETAGGLLQSTLPSGGSEGAYRDRVSPVRALVRQAASTGLRQGELFGIEAESLPRL